MGNRKMTMGDLRRAFRDANDQCERFRIRLAGAEIVLKRARVRNDEKTELRLAAEIQLLKRDWEYWHTQAQHFSRAMREGK